MLTCSVYMFLLLLLLRFSGAVIIFTGLLSRLVLRRRLQWFKWVGIFFVICGLAVVGVCDLIYTHGGGGGSNFV